MFHKINDTLTRLKNKNPVILNITNFVTMDFIANGLLSLGASPIMSCAEQEAEDLVKISSAVVINIGTLNENFIALCETVCAAANKNNIPIILDPVGVGASQYRTQTCKKLIDNYQFAIIRGNAAEIANLAGVDIQTKGVDSSVQSDSVLESAKILSVTTGATVVISGAQDFIVQDNNYTLLECGSVLMTKITGAGCLLSAVVAAFHAVEKNSYDASLMAAYFYGKCGEKAAVTTQKPGSFKVNFLDSLSETCYEA